MKRALLPWLLFIICSNTLSYSASESTLPPKAEVFKPWVQNNQHKNAFDIGGDRRREEGVHKVVHLDSLKKGKASYGGQDVLRNPHPAPPRRGASSLIVRPSSLLSTALRHVAVGLLICGFFF